MYSQHQLCILDNYIDPIYTLRNLWVRKIFTQLHKVTAKIFPQIMWAGHLLYGICTSFSEEEASDTYTQYGTILSPSSAHLSSVVVNHVTEVDNCLLKHSVGGGIRNHDSSQVLTSLLHLIITWQSHDYRTLRAALTLDLKSSMLTIPVLSVGM